MKLKTFAIVILSLTISNCIGQNNKVMSYSFKKGEVLDVMLLTTAPNSKDKYMQYRKTAFPVAFEYSYQPQKGFKISELTLGTHKPYSLIFGKWASKEKRENFLADITKRVPDFHQQRRALFPYFDLTYYEMKQDFTFSINREKYNVATSFWVKDTKKSNRFIKKWEKDIKKMGGNIVLHLNDGTSPTGYVYNPDQFYIVEWNDKSAFKAFAKKYDMNSYNALKNVHQLKID